jgi:gentisate 1,2-dioxygenase
MQTMSAWLTHFVKGFETKPMRSTDGQIFVVLEGEVEAKFDEETLKAGPNDVLAAPAWVWRQFRAARDSVVFAFSDRSAQEKLGLWREERQ